MVCNNAGDMFGWQKGNWQKAPGNAKHVSCLRNGYGHNICCNSSHQIYKHGM
jgi:hypothetical protein